MFCFKLWVWLTSELSFAVLRKGVPGGHEIPAEDSRVDRHTGLQPRLCSRVPKVPRLRHLCNSEGW